MKTTITLSTFLIFILLACNQKPEFKTVNGPETTDLLKDVNGYIVYDEPVGGIRAIMLPLIKEIIVRKENCNKRPIHSLSGPSENGLIAFVEYEMEGDGIHFLKTINIDGSDEQTIFERTGDALWDDVIGDYLAISPSGMFIALVSSNNKTDSTFNLEIWDLQQKKKINTPYPAIDHGYISWLHNEKKVAYTGLVPGKKISKVPAICIYDLDKSTSSFIHEGYDPVVSYDGSRIVWTDGLQNYFEFDLITNNLKPLNYLGNAGGPIAYARDDLVISWCYPTKGNSAQWTKNNSPLVTPKAMLAIKLVDLATGKFQTIMPAVDPRREISFGNIKK